MPDGPPGGVHVREARPDERDAIAAVLDAAMLRTDSLGSALDRDDVLAAVAEERVLGALVLVQAEDAGGEHRHVDAVAVRPNRRGQGIGSALVADALDRCGPEERLTAAFDADVRPFYESLGFDIEERDGRLFGVR